MAFPSLACGSPGPLQGVQTWLPESLGYTVGLWSSECVF